MWPPRTPQPTTALDGSRGDLDRSLPADDKRGRVQLVMFLWFSTRLKAGFEPQSFGGHRLPDRAPERAAALHACL
jgi:hypothetical protein